MKRFTKALCMFLAIVMVVGLLPLSIIAEDIQTTHTVQFKLNYNGAHKIPSQKVADGECAVQPDDVTREGWIFEYWYVKTGDGIQKFDLSQPITEDVTLYARWDEDIEYWGPIWNRNILGAIEDSEDDEENDIDLPQTVFTHEGGKDNPNLVVDSKEKILYYNNMLIVVLTHAVSDDIKVEVSQSVSGTIVGQIDGAFQLLQIMIPETDYSSINDLCSKLMGNENVLYATYDTYIETEQASIIDNNPWSTKGSISDKGNENNPSGNDWWAEAIGAYTAWRYSDYAEEVVIGQIDSGFELDHNDLKGQITMLEGYSSNTPSEHGTMVAGITVAKNNDFGLRGVADFASIVGIDDELATYSFNCGQYMDAVSAMLSSGVKIINLEAYYPLCGEKEYKKINKEYGNLYNSYDEYKEAHLTKYAYYSAKLLMAALCSAKNSGYDDFICVQAAGNGYDGDGKQGIDAKYSGFFASINRESYELFVKENINKSEYIPDYSFFDERIIIVSGVDNSRDNNGNYYIKGLNYGADVDICACSYNIYSTHLNNTHYSQYEGGTSSAAPMVAGAVAFIWGINPSLSAPKVKSILLNNYTYKAIGKNESKGWEYPMLNVGAAVEATIEYSNYITISGYIIDDAGAAIKDTTIKLILFNDSSNEIHVLDTDKLGCIYGFSDSDVIFTKARIEAVGYEPKVIDVDYYINNNYSLGTIQLTPEKIISAHITGNIIDISDSSDGVPMVGDVKVTFYKDGIYQDFTYINNGVIDLTWVIEGNFKFVFEKEGYDSVTLDNIQIKNGENSLGIIEMKKSATTFSITHTNNNITTDILAASPIEVYNGIAIMTWTINSNAPWTIVTNRGDWFSLSVDGKSVGLNSTFNAGETILKLNISKYTDSRNDGTIAFEVGDKTYTVEIFQKAYAVTGTIVAGDDPVSGAKVVVSNEYYTSSGVTTGVDGRFFINVPNAWYDITINTDVYGEVVIPSAGNVNGMNADVGIIDLAPITVSGTITIDGKPVSGAEVTITNGTITMILYTDENGNYYTNLPEGWYTVSVAVVGYAKYETTVHITSSSSGSFPMGTIVLEIRELLTSATGTIVDFETGEPIEDVDVNLVFTAADDGEITTAHSTSMEDGTYLFDFFEEGTCSITYSHADYSTKVVENIVIDEDYTTFETLELIGIKIIDSGKCGDDLNWVLNENGVMTISGTGDMWGFQEGYDTNANNGGANNQEWYTYKNDIVKVIIKSGVDSIGQYAFAYHSNLETVEIEAGLIRIDSWAFLRCTKLKNINIPNTVTFLGGKLFSYCALTEIYIPESVTFMGSWTFESDGILKDIYFYGDLPHVCSADSFRHATDITLHYVEGKERWTESQLTLGSYSFPTETWIPSSNYKYNQIIQKEGFEFLIVDGKANLIWYSGSDTEVNIPATVNGYDVVGIAPVAFCKQNSCNNGLSNITSIVVPENIREIHKTAVDSLSNLQSIILPSTLISMGEYAIHNNKSLRSVYFYGDFPEIYGRGMIFVVDTPPTLYYISGKAGWSSSTWNAPDGTVYNTATWKP